MKFFNNPRGAAIGGVGAVVAACALAACGSSGSGGAVTSKTASASVSGSSKLPQVTIGVLPIVGKESEVLTQDIDGIEQGAALLGWKVQYTDPDGSTTAMQSAMASMIQNHDAAIITMAIDAPLLGSELAAAKSAGIPVINVNNEVDPATVSEFSAQIAPSETTWGTILGQFIKRSLTPGSVIEEVNAPYTGHHEADVAMGIARPAGFTVAKVEETDLTNIEASFQAVTREGLQSVPSAKFILVPGDFAPAIVAPVLKLINRNDVTILARYDDQATIALMRAGTRIVDVTTNLYTPGLTALNEIAAYLTNKTPFVSITGGSTFPFKVYTTQTIGSYPKTGYAWTLASTLAPFAAEWKHDYGIS